VSGYNVKVRAAKTLRQLLGGTSDAGVRFDDLCRLLESLGFEKRVRGSHHVFRRAGVEEMVNLQREGHNAKPYQVKQTRAVILKYKLGDIE
jgi:predicted RNA binding protein YcfA (HicA-like mRNA interferase family)